MNEFSREELQELLAVEEGPCVSIFVPTHKTGSETQQANIRLKNLLRETENKLENLGFKAPQIKKLLKPVQQFIGDSLFWQHQQTGLALFISPSFFRYFKLPIKVRERTTVGKRFFIKPLLGMFSMRDHFYVLAISQKQVRLLQCTPHSSVRLEMEGAPENLDEVLKYDDPEKQVHFHTRAPSSGEGRRAAVSYGHGDENYVEKENLRRFFSQIDRALIKTLGAENAPLVFAGVDFLFPIYREISNYKNILDKHVEGNPELLRDEELQEHSWKTIEPLFQNKLDNAADRFRELSGTGKTSTDIREVAPAAANGRVELLFVATGVSLHGNIDFKTNQVEIKEDGSDAENEDLLDFAAVHTFLNSGVVYPVPQEEIPEEGQLAAIFRY